MFGEPPDEDSECNARLFISDNYGDGSATIRCQLVPKHEGLHQEQFERQGHMVTITWVVDERERCDHGCGQWKHAHGRQYDDNSIPCPKYADDHEFSACAHCNPEYPPLTCGACGKTHYFIEGHKRHCPKEPYTCETCGEHGVGPHDCPKALEEFLSRGTDDEFAGDDFSEPLPAPAVEPQS